MEFIYTVPQKKKRKIPYYHLYVLKLEHDKYYVGISKNVKKRYERHLSGEGAEWTKLHKPIKIISDIQLAYCTYTKVKPFEDQKTIDMMRLHGRDNVRGGIYCAVDQSVVDSLLGEELCSSIDVSAKKEIKKHQYKLNREKITNSKKTKTNTLYEKIKGFTIVVYLITRVSLPIVKMHLAREYVRIPSKRKKGMQIPIYVDYKNHKIYISNMEMARHTEALKKYFEGSEFQTCEDSRFL